MGAILYMRRVVYVKISTKYTTSAFIDKATAIARSALCKSLAPVALGTEQKVCIHADFWLLV